MRKVQCKKLWRWTLKLRCRRCGKQETFYIDRKDSVPTHGINGWTLRVAFVAFNGMLLDKDTELCWRCTKDLREQGVISVKHYGIMT
jgi:hypothetical protein